MKSAPSTCPTTPNWLPKKAVSTMNQIMRDCLHAAGITEQIHFRYLNELDVLTRQHLPASSLLYCHSSKYNNDHTITCILTGVDARNHKARVLLSLSPTASETLRRFLVDSWDNLYQPKMIPNPVLRTTAAPAAPAADPSSVALAKGGGTLRSSTQESEGRAQFDDDALALYLSSLQELGSLVTMDTAMTIGLRSTGALAIYHAAQERGLLKVERGIGSLTDEGYTLLKRLDAPAPAAVTTPKDGPSEFERLRAAVQSARQHHATIEAEHHKHRAQAATIRKDLELARQEHHEAQQTLVHLEARLMEMKGKVILKRDAILRFEAEQKKLPNEAALHAAQRDLESAERAYNDLIKL